MERPTTLQPPLDRDVRDPGSYQRMNLGRNPSSVDGMPRPNGREPPMMTPEESRVEMFRMVQDQAALLQQCLRNPHLYSDSYVRRVESTLAHAYETAVFAECPARQLDRGALNLPSEMVPHPPINDPRVLPTQPEAPPYVETVQSPYFMGPRLGMDPVNPPVIEDPNNVGPNDTYLGQQAAASPYPGPAQRQYLGRNQTGFPGISADTFGNSTRGPAPSIPSAAMPRSTPIYYPGSGVSMYDQRVNIPAHMNTWI